jgi:ABC-2 type transport system permease protein
MKASIFEPTIFKKNLRRFMPLWLSYFFIWILILSGTIINTGMSELALETQSSIANFNRLIEEVARGGAAVISLGFMILSAVLVFSFMHNENSTVFVSSLPLKRENVFWTTVASGIIPIIIANILIFLLMLLLSLSMELKIAGALLYWLKASTLISVGYYGLAVLCCNVSGNAIASIILYAIFNFVAVVVYAAHSFVAQLFLYGFTAQGLPEAFITKFSPPVMLVLGPLFGLQGEYASSELYLVLFSLVAIALIFISSFFYKKRKMETAGEFISQSCLRPVFRVCMGLGSALVLGVILYSIFFGNLRGGASFTLFLLCALISAAAGYYVGEALLEKKLDCFKNKKSNLMFLGVSLVIIAFVLCLKLDVFGYEKRIPMPENVKSFSISARGPELKDCDNIEVIEEAIELHKILVENEAESLEKDDRIQFYIDINYELKDGSKLAREYRFYYNPKGSYEDLPEALKATERFINLKPLVLERLKLDFKNMQETYAYIELDFLFENRIEKHEQYSEEWGMKRFRDFYENAVMKDAENGNIGHLSILHDEKALGNYYDCSIWFSYLIEEEDERGVSQKFYRHWSIRPERNSEYTLAWLKEQGIEPTLCIERKNWEKDYSNYYDYLFWYN